jgi:hypothetical protein
MTKIAGSGSRIRIRIQDPDPDPDPLGRGMDPRIRIRIHPKISWIRNTALKPPGPTERHQALQKHDILFFVLFWMPTDPDFESVPAGANVSHPDVPKDFKTHVSGTYLIQSR